MPTARLLSRLRAALVVALPLLPACGDAPAVGPPDGATVALPCPLVTLPQPVWMDEEMARRTFPALQKDNSRMTWDPLAIMVLKPDSQHSFPFAEYPGGTIEFRTNNLGFREDEPTQVAKAGRRILVLGDSQTEGVVYNRESLANVLEARLAAAGEPAEVINGGIGATGPHNYLGLLLKHRELRPDVVIVMIFTGNDFAHSLQLDDMIHGRKSSLLARKELQELKDRWPELLPQSFTQAFLFHDDRPAAELAVAAARTACEEIAHQCADLGARLLVAILPTRPELDLDDEERVAEIVQAFGMTHDDIFINARLGESLRQQLEAQGIETLDLRPALRAAPAPRYWKKDYHLNITGHAAVAGAREQALAGT